MKNRLLRLFILAAVFSSGLFALNVKIVAVDYRVGQITVLLPMHNTTMEAELVSQEPEIRVRLNEFYEAQMEPGRVDTVKRNVLRIKIPHERPVKFRVRKITFLDH